MQKPERGVKQALGSFTKQLMRFQRIKTKINSLRAGITKAAKNNCTDADLLE